MNKYNLLKTLINDSETLVVPDAYDGLSAKMIELCGFKAVQCSGYSMSISKMLKDETLLTLEDNLKRTKEIVAAVDVPVIADGEDGYGNKNIFRQNIIKFIETGIAGINIEDQILWDPYCSEKIVSMDKMTDKVDEVIKIKKEMGIENFVLNARTDALRSLDNREKALGLAIERANTYLDLGADICFIAYVKTKSEIEILAREIDGPISIAAGLPYNIDEFSINDCIELGIARVSLPTLLISGVMKNMKSILDRVREEGSFEEVKNQMIDYQYLQKIF
ncbi:isocitrate lyase/PEP mutase family protein [Natronospora cellulosivora (SeqCode)]